MTPKQILDLLRQRAAKEEDVDDSSSIMLPIGIVLAKQRLDLGDAVVVWRHQHANRLGRLNSIEARMVKGQPGVRFGVFTGLTTKDFGMTENDYKSFYLSEIDDDCDLQPISAGLWRLVLCPQEGT